MLAKFSPAIISVSAPSLQTLRQLGFISQLDWVFFRRVIVRETLELPDNISSNQAFSSSIISFQPVTSCQYSCSRSKSSCTSVLLVKKSCGNVSVQ